MACAGTQEYVHKSRKGGAHRSRIYGHSEVGGVQAR